MSGNAHLELGGAIFFSTNKDGSRRWCLLPSGIAISNDSRAFRRAGPVLLQNKETASQNQSLFT